MLTSSEAKWRCMWHMLIWSALLTLVSQFLVITDHVAFWIFSLLSLLVLPVFTAIYSNTSGRHGAGLIRVAYVICDPVLACISITPVLILNHLPEIAVDYSCLVQSDTLNQTCICLINNSHRNKHEDHRHCGRELYAGGKSKVADGVQTRFVIVQISVAIPVLISLVMGRRTRKMSLNTYLLTFAYWFVITIEAVDLLETMRLGDTYQDVIYTTMSIIAISVIITNSYAVVTLCSFISPQAGRNKRKTRRHFDFIYQVLVGCSGALFMETPLLVARFQILTNNVSKILPATFYLWFIKDFVFLFLITAVIFMQKLKKKYVAKVPCRVNFDNPDIVFKPEKRDEYIERCRRVRFKDPPATTFGEDENDPSTRENFPSTNVAQVSTTEQTIISEPESSPPVALNNSLINTNQCDHGEKDSLASFQLTSQLSTSVNPLASILKGARPKIHNLDVDNCLTYPVRFHQRDLDASSDISVEAAL